MIVIPCEQGTEEWKSIRAKHFTASEASAMMGASKNTSRSELLRMKATGTEKEFSDWVQKNLLDEGHRIEALARPIAEQIIGEDLYPITATDDEGYLLASFDGVTLMEDIIWEGKSWNEAKAESVRSGVVPEDDYWQVIQQLAVSVADKCLYMVTDGTIERTVYTWISLVDSDVPNLMASWKQFSEDLDNYQHVETVPEPEGEAPESLPALHIELTGMVTASNLVVFKETAMAVIGSVCTDLQTDSDFASAELGIKWCKDVESRLGAAKDHALSQTASIDELFRTLDTIKAEARTKRLSLEKLVKSRKQSIRGEILQAGKTALTEHVAALNKRIGKPYMPEIAADFAGVMKGKRNIASLRDAVDTELARTKIESNEWADLIQVNLNSLRDMGADHAFLFSDTSDLVLKDNRDLESTIKARISDHKESEQKRLDAEREAIRIEEEAKAKRKADAEIERVRKEDAAKAEIAAANASSVVGQQQHPLADKDQRGKTAEATHGEPKATASPQAPAASTSPATKARPTDAQIIAVLADHFSVHESNIISWLADMDLEAAEKSAA